MEELNALVAKVGSGQTAALLVVCIFFARKIGADINELASGLEASAAAGRAQGLVEVETGPAEDLAKQLRRLASASGARPH